MNSRILSDTRNYGLLDVTQFSVSRSVVSESEWFLREVGNEGFEGLILWAGRRREASQAIIDVVDFIAPEQTLIRGQNGVGLRVDGDELFRVNAELYRSRLVLVAQVHSHPSEAYHSTTDDTYAVVTIPGGLSLVVPDFANAPLDVATAAVYRLNGDGHWIELPRSDAERLIQVSTGSSMGRD